MEKGFGFATDETIPGEDYFVHQSEFISRADFALIEKGSRVRIVSLSQRERGLRAHGISLA
jgi:cold shock CspA family protein